ATFENSNSGIPKAFVSFSAAFISLLLMASSPFSSGSVLRDARLRHESSRSVFDQLSMSFNPAPTLLCGMKAGPVGTLCDSRAEYFWECQHRPTYIYGNGAVHNRDSARAG